MTSVFRNCFECLAECLSFEALKNPFVTSWWFHFISASQCMHASDDQHSLPIPRPHDLEWSNCYYRIYIPKAVTGGAGECTPTQLTFYNMKYGHESSFNQQLLPKFIVKKPKDKDYYCFNVSTQPQKVASITGPYFAGIYKFYWIKSQMYIVFQQDAKRSYLSSVTCLSVSFN